ncbi:hypothetical protein M427DRAFT_26899 [Gonapodya prolifera JEL478]|uniref:Uncharacterized protein n=1 Tax=Gonapodya prolifera (strain JEL478) TaxID=1344416 RepID=A0A139B0H2_GONPJ|nr:hypothetical protein M427DRAFT_26899 [Gonapodya prolifera JEL478]|eukprot:KXS22303.1 hypothetical protein M427DRAFT_26899 [Gonapodya prolifera JEL478]
MTNPPPSTQAFTFSVPAEPLPPGVARSDTSATVASGNNAQTDQRTTAAVHPQQGYGSYDYRNYSSYSNPYPGYYPNGSTPAPFYFQYPQWSGDYGSYYAYQNAGHYNGYYQYSGQGQKGGDKHGKGSPPMPSANGLPGLPPSNSLERHRTAEEAGKIRVSQGKPTSGPNPEIIAAAQPTPRVERPQSLAPVTSTATNAMSTPGSFVASSRLHSPVESNVRGRVSEGGLNGERAVPNATSDSGTANKGLRDDRGLSSGKSEANQMFTEGSERPNLGAGTPAVRTNKRKYGDGPTMMELEQTGPIDVDGDSRPILNPKSQVPDRVKALRTTGPTSDSSDIDAPSRKRSKTGKSIRDVGLAQFAMIATQNADQGSGTDSAEEGEILPNQPKRPRVINVRPGADPYSVEISTGKGVTSVYGGATKPKKDKANVVRGPAALQPKEVVASAATTATVNKGNTANSTNSANGGSVGNAAGAGNASLVANVTTGNAVNVGNLVSAGTTANGQPVPALSRKAKKLLKQQQLLQQMQSGQLTPQQIAQQQKEQKKKEQKQQQKQQQKLQQQQQQQKNAQLQKTANKGAGESTHDKGHDPKLLARIGHLTSRANAYRQLAKMFRDTLLCLMRVVDVALDDESFVSQGTNDSNAASKPSSNENTGDRQAQSDSNNLTIPSQIDSTMEIDHQGPMPMVQDGGEPVTNASSMSNGKSIADARGEVSGGDLMESTTSQQMDTSVLPPHKDANANPATMFTGIFNYPTPTPAATRRLNNVLDGYGLSFAAIDRISSVVQLDLLEIVGRHVTGTAVLSGRTAVTLELPPIAGDADYEIGERTVGKKTKRNANLGQSWAGGNGRLSEPIDVDALSDGEVDERMSKMEVVWTKMANGKWGLNLKPKENAEQAPKKRKLFSGPKSRKEWNDGWDQPTMQVSD